MSSNISSAEIAVRIAEAQRLAPNIEGVAGNVTALIKAWPSDKGLYPELKRLADFIEQTKTEIAALRPAEVKASFLPSATDELDATVAATADASNRIMDAGDKLMELAQELSPEQNDRMMGYVTTIYEACSFQDITGQRITKVVKTLKVIEERIDSMLASQGTSPATGPNERVNGPRPSAMPSDEELLNGPALPGQARTQAEIDALLGF